MIARLPVAVFYCGVKDFNTENKPVLVAHKGTRKHIYIYYIYPVNSQMHTYMHTMYENTHAHVHTHTPVSYTHLTLPTMAVV